MPRIRRYGEYAPLRPGPARRRPWLRTAQLNIVGWSGLVLSLVAVGAVVFADRRRWAGMETGFGWGGSVDEVTRVVEELRKQGVRAQVRPDAQYEQPWWDRIDTPPDAEPTASLVYTNRHLREVRSVLRAHGIAQPGGW